MLSRALAGQGLGAKTAVGYGRFKTTGNASAGTGAERWIKETIEVLCKRYNERNPKAMSRGKAMAGAWGAIEDENLKGEVKAALENYWRREGITLTPRVSKLYSPPAQ